jgi:hypothetical protein
MNLKIKTLLIGTLLSSSLMLAAPAQAHQYPHDVLAEVLFGLHYDDSRHNHRHHYRGDYYPEYRRSDSHGYRHHHRDRHRHRHGDRHSYSHGRHRDHRYR